MEHLKINSIKNKQDNSHDIIKYNREYITNFISEHKEDFIKKHFEIFVDDDFLRELGYDDVYAFIKFLLDVSEGYILNFLNTLLEFTPFINHWYMNLFEMQIDKMEIEEGYLSCIRLEKTNINELTCTPKSVEEFRRLCERSEHSVIEKVIINTNRIFTDYAFKRRVEDYLNDATLHVKEFIFE